MVELLKTALLKLVGSALLTVSDRAVERFRSQIDCSRYVSMQFKKQKKKKHAISNKTSVVLMKLLIFKFERPSRRSRGSVT